MQEGENIGDFFGKRKKITNAMSLNGDTLTDQVICEKVLRSLTKKFSHCVNSNEDITKLEDLNVEELQSKTEAKEMRLNLLEGEGGEDQTLLSKSKGKNGTN